MDITEVSDGFVAWQGTYARFSNNMISLLNGIHIVIATNKTFLFIEMSAESLSVLDIEGYSRLIDPGGEPCVIQHKHNWSSLNTYNLDVYKEILDLPFYKWSRGCRVCPNKHMPYMFPPLSTTVTVLITHDFSHFHGMYTKYKFNKNCIIFADDTIDNDVHRKCMGATGIVGKR